MGESRDLMLRTPTTLVSGFTKSVSALAFLLVLSACSSNDTDGSGSTPSASGSSVASGSSASSGSTSGSSSGSGSGGSGGGGASGGPAIVLPAGSNSAVLKWSPNTEPDLAGYRVYYGTEPRQYFQAKGQGIVVVGNSFTVTGLSSGVRYYFAVTAFDEASNESDYSAERFKDIP